jgi:hypothetical protein
MDPRRNAHAGDTGEPSAIARAMVEDLEASLVAVHVAPTGSGKSHSAAETAAILYLAGLATCIAVPTLRLAREMMARLRRLAPEAFEAGAVAQVCGRHRPSIDREDSRPAGGGTFPIGPDTRIVVCTHAQLGRRGFSRYLRTLWSKLGAGGEPENPRPAFCLIIDELASWLDDQQWEIPLKHRYQTRLNPDGSGGRRVPQQDCPRWAGAGNCANCTLAHYGGEPQYNPTFESWELAPPRPRRFGRWQKMLTRLEDPIRMADDLALGPEVSLAPYAKNVFVAEVLRFRGESLLPSLRPRKQIEVFQREPNGQHPAEDTADILAHLLDFAYGPIVVEDHPVNRDGAKVDPDSLAAVFRAKVKGWHPDVRFPQRTCQAPRLVLTDLVVLEQVRRFAAGQKVGVVLAGATLGTTHRDVLEQVFPSILIRRHPYPPRRILQVAVAFVTGRRAGLSSLLCRDDDAGDRLITRVLERHGKGVIFARTKAQAQKLFARVHGDHPTARFVHENVEEEYLSIERTAFEDTPVGCVITYGRGILGTGANADLRFVVSDALAFRPIASFCPGDMSPEAYFLAQAEERRDLVLQNLGRGPRGEAGKTVVLFVLNADPPLIEAIKSAPALVEGAERAPVCVQATTLDSLIPPADLWLENDGGEWPKVPAQSGKTKHSGRRGRTPEDLVRAADAAVALMPYAEFARKHSLYRRGQEVRDAIRARWSASQMDP